MVYRVAIIGCGRPRREVGSTGFGQSHLHAEGYKRSGKCELSALVDIVPENAERFAQEHGDPEHPPAIFADYEEMLKQVQPDIVSICTWPHLHAPMAGACAQAGVKAVHCEKPMAPSWSEAQCMAEECERRNTQLTFNHQRRFEAPFRTAKRLLQEGTIGSLHHLEGHCDNLFDWGTHWFDMFFFYQDETPARWVLAQIDNRIARKAFGVPIEWQALSHFQYVNGTYGLLFTGRDSAIGCANRLVGSEGIIEVQARLADGSSAPVRVQRSGSQGWEYPDFASARPPLLGNSVAQGIADLLDALEAGREPELSARRALRATELIFASYESSRRRGRVDLPLVVTDSPFVAMIEAGAIEVGAPPST
ncbi:MAG: Gfo/Idh/MocA family oxidoreductase [Chloroflexi bacterium]|nr:Gfo/Idh/MocA family oxidoreductase [Chloroflexota bacterium]